MSKVCAKHGVPQFIPDGEECPYCEPAPGSVPQFNSVAEVRAHYDPVGFMFGDAMALSPSMLSRWRGDSPSKPLSFAEVQAAMAALSGVQLPPVALDTVCDTLGHLYTSTGGGNEECMRCHRSAPASAFGAEACDIPPDPPVFISWSLAAPAIINGQEFAAGTYPDPATVAKMSEHFKGLRRYSHRAEREWDAERAPHIPNPYLGVPSAQAAIDAFRPDPCPPLVVYDEAGEFTAEQMRAVMDFQRTTAGKMQALQAIVHPLVVGDGDE